MKKDVERQAKAGDDLEVLSEIIKNDPWLLEKVLNKIRVIRGGQAESLGSMASKSKAPTRKQAK